jgi:hypothetical protein
MAEKPSEEKSIETSGASRRLRREENKPVESTSTNPCPFNGKFGIDIDQLDSCGDCPKYNPCADEADRIEEEKKKNQRPLRRRGA